MDPVAPQQRQNKPPVEITCSQGFLSWLNQEKISLAFTTYQSSRLFFLGLKENGALSAFERLFDHAMGLWATPDSLIMSSRYQLWRFENALAPGELYNEYDRLYVPRKAYTTGDLDIHDVVVDKNGDVIFVNTLYSCLSTVSDRYSFKPYWQPPFISQLAHEDRCHLNGLALVKGEAKYVTAVSRSDVVSGWRDRRNDGGVVVDIQTDEIVAQGLSMPHSPRYYRGKLWLCNSGKGYFGSINLKNGEFEPVAFCPGYMRGLAFCGDYAIVGLSKPRNKAFTGLDLDHELESRDAEPWCGFMVININTGEVAHWARIEGVVTELYDVQILPKVRRPMALGLKNKEIWHIITIDSGDLGKEKNVPHTWHVPVEDKTSNYKFESQTGIDPSEARKFEPFSYPRLSARWKSLPPAGKVNIVTASNAEGLVGACISEMRPDNFSAEIISLAVAAPYRNQGIAGKLVSEMEAVLRNLGLKAMDLTYRTNWDGATALELLAKKQGWAPSKPLRVLGKSTTKSIAGAEWLNMPFPNHICELFDWGDLTEDDRRDIQERIMKDPEFPRELSPFLEEKIIEPKISIGLRHKGQIAGWSIAHRVAPDTLQYSALYLSKELRGKDVAMPLMIEAARRRLAAKIPNALFMMDVRNEAVLKFFDKNFRPYIQDVSEARMVHKMLG
ncbi:TIGR03032 family protein [Desulfatibacillum aliphaticivorans]|uniref:TIGR03032 family protein n=1 Tax=Desulfatibacillum aliphaticivorans TaxID=218208 RepID=UPI000407CF55|nr:TIGR03032 family protein [Desulfatibacillum aliphaticivorans]